jgi:ribosomal protein S8
MPSPSALDDIMSSRSSTPSCELVHEIVQGVQDEGFVGSAEVGQEVSLRLDRLRRAWAIAERRRTS